MDVRITFDADRNINLWVEDAQGSHVPLDRGSFYGVVLNNVRFASARDAEGRERKEVYGTLVGQCRYTPDANVEANVRRQGRLIGFYWHPGWPVTLNTDAPQDILDEPGLTQADAAIIYRQRLDWPSAIAVNPR